MDLKLCCYQHSFFIYIRRIRMNNICLYKVDMKLIRDYAHIDDKKCKAHKELMQNQLKS